MSNNNFKIIATSSKFSVKPDRSIASIGPPTMFAVARSVSQLGTIASALKHDPNNVTTPAAGSAYPPAN